jgi:hypothetical protein
MSSLVSVLAKEMDVWPDDQAYFTCDPSGEIRASLDIQYDFHPKESVNESERTADCAGIGDDLPRVTREMWQAERDRQKGGEWKRHRGGKQPVADDVVVEYKTRSGYTDTWSAKSLSWSHEGSEGDLMQYRIISQPQAEEVEVKDMNIGTISYTISVDQIAGPLAWRDTIIHCQAIIEDCEREIERNTQRLASEGFELISQINSNLDKIDVTLESAFDVGDWRSWKAGAIVEISTSDNESWVQHKGKQGTLTINKLGSQVISFSDGGEWYMDDNTEHKLIRP